MQTFEKLIKEHGEWADATFPKGTAHGALLHAEREAAEVIADFEADESMKKVAMEVADFMGCVMDSLRRDGIDTAVISKMLDMLCVSNVALYAVRVEFENKLRINKLRKWKDNGDGSYSHIKE